MPYKASVDYQRLYLLGHEISPGKTLPMMFHAIRSLDLQISLQRVSLPGSKVGASASRHLALHRYLTACISPRLTRASNLQRLRVELVVKIPFFVACKEQPDQLRQALESKSSALRTLRGRAEASISIDFLPVVNQLLKLDRPNGPLRSWKMEFMSILQAFSYDLEQFIST